MCMAAFCRERHQYYSEAANPAGPERRQNTLLHLFRLFGTRHISGVQMVQNCHISTRSYDHISLVFASLHWILDHDWVNIKDSSAQRTQKSQSGSIPALVFFSFSFFFFSPVVTPISWDNQVWQFRQSGDTVSWDVHSQLHNSGTTDFCVSVGGRKRPSARFSTHLSFCPPPWRNTLSCLCACSHWYSII